MEFMKLSDSTLTVLKNFAGINNSILVKEGSQLRTISVAKNILAEEKSTIDFAYACVVSIKEIQKGELLTKDNIWVKRPGTGEIKAKDYEILLGKKALKKININEQLTWEDFEK